MLEDFKQFNLKDIKFKTDCYGKDLTESVKLLESYLQGMNKVFENKQTDFVNLCVYTYKLYELFKDYLKTWYGGFDTENERYTYYKIMSSFGIDETYASKLRSCFEKYIMLFENEYSLKAKFFGFCSTKLIELLPVPYEQLIIDIDMIDESDFCIFYYDENYLPPKRKMARTDLLDYQPKSGTAVAYNYAIQKKKQIKNFYK